MISDDDSGPILVQLFAAKDQSVVHLFDLERAEQEEIRFSRDFDESEHGAYLRFLDLLTLLESEDQALLICDIVSHLRIDVDEFFNRACAAKKAVYPKPATEN
ncbi:hypothetical protein [Parvibaculum sp.]|uniref:hypothetical protein n=1 Tax=Parvibaculum sp. TaxID=2024848 RepID=UPI001DBD1DAA|nr:hypothetical protein [Parvibaculum sp.]MBX3488535.1 hypothetical protein [Parvibaculum sp.]